MEQCKYIFEGSTETNGQEHLYIETQGAYAVPQENGAITDLFFHTGTNSSTTNSCKSIEHSDE